MGATWLDLESYDFDDDQIAQQLQPQGGRQQFMSHRVGMADKIRPLISPCALTARIRARSLKRSRINCASLSSNSARLPPVRFWSSTAETKNCTSMEGTRWESLRSTIS